MCSQYTYYTQCAAENIIINEEGEDIAVVHNIFIFFFLFLYEEKELK